MARWRITTCSQVLVSPVWPAPARCPAARSSAHILLLLPSTGHRSPETPLTELLSSRVRVNRSTTEDHNQPPSQICQHYGWCKFALLQVTFLMSQPGQSEGGDHIVGTGLDNQTRRASPWWLAHSTRQSQNRELPLDCADPTCCQLEAVDPQ